MTTRPHRSDAAHASRLLVLGLASSLAGTAAMAAKNAPTPPETLVETVIEEMHGESIVDDFRWLESLQAEDPAVEAWTEAQESYAREILDALPFRDVLSAQFEDLMSSRAVSKPVMRQESLFFSKREPTQNQPVVYVTDASAKEADGGRVLLDVNTLADAPLVSLDWFEPSPDGQLLAFGTSYAGSEMSVLNILEVATGDWLADEIPGKVDFGGWHDNGRGFLYGKLDDVADPYSRSWCYHELGRHQRHDPTLFTQDDPSEIPGAMLSRDGKWVVLQIFKGWSKSDLFVYDATRWILDGEKNQRPISVDKDARFEPITIVDDMLYVLTTHGDPNGRFIRVDLSAETLDDPSTWTTVIPAREGYVLTDVSESDGLFVATWETDAANSFSIYENDGTFVRHLTLPTVGSASIETHHDRTTAFYAFESFNTPPTIYRLDLRAEPGTTDDVWSEADSRYGNRLDSISVTKVFYESKDGTKVPAYRVQNDTLVTEGSSANPTVIYGYGGFNISIRPRFVASNIPWYENGGIYVSANLRGGGEGGEAWHADGMLGNKQNVYDDLYAVAEGLIGEGVTSPDHLAVLGGSNGGLLTGVAATQRPELWAAAVSAVPLLDMLRYQRFLMAQFWIPEYGDPANPEHFAWIRAYSPYHNVRKDTFYPAMLFTAGENDSRVHPLHARKMAALMQRDAANDPAEDPILLLVDTEGGHGQGKPLSARVEEAVDRWSFLMWQTGLLDDMAERAAADGTGVGARPEAGEPAPVGAGAGAGSDAPGSETP